jgi:predicted acyltransferase
VISGLLGRLTLLIKLPKAGGKSVYLKTWLFEHSFGLLTRAPIHASPYNASLMWGLGYVLVFLLLAIWMYRRGMFLKA